MKAVVWYDDFKLAACAKVMLERAASSAGAEPKWNVRPWRLDTLQHEAAAVEALSEAVGADLILVVTGTTRVVPDCLADWLESWAACRRVPDAALGALFTLSDTAAAPRLIVQLRQFAEHHELTFLFNQEMFARLDSNHSTRKRNNARICKDAMHC